MKAKLRKLAAAWWTVAKGSIHEDGGPLLDMALAGLFLLPLAAIVGAFVPYGPALLLSGYLPQSVGTFLAYQCLAGPTCDFYSLMGSLALGIYLTLAVILMVVLMVWRLLDWKEVEREVEVEDAVEGQEIAEAVDAWLRKEGYDEFRMGGAQGVGENGPM